MRYSTLIKTCEDIWLQMQSMHEDIPDVVITVGSGGRRAATLYGHFANDAWHKINNEDESVHEVLLVAEQLTRPAEDIFTTLLHEAVHGIANTRGIRDVSGKRHNKKFAMLCMEVGLDAPEDVCPKLGYSAATLSTEAREFWNEQIEMLDEALVFARKLKLTEKKARKTTWVALCGCGRKLRIGKKALEGFSQEDIRILCEQCEQPFVLEDDEELEQVWQS